MTADLRVVPPPAELLNAAADWLEADPARWGRDWFVDKKGCRCAAGAIAYAANPDRDTEEGGNPNTGDGSYDAVEVFADYLVHALGAPRCEAMQESEPIETVGGWNDDPARTPAQVIDALRDAARHYLGAAA